MERVLFPSTHNQLNDHKIVYINKKEYTFGVYDLMVVGASLFNRSIKINIFVLCIICELPDLQQYF